MSRCRRKGNYTLFVRPVSWYESLYFSGEGWEITNQDKLFSMLPPDTIIPHSALSQTYKRYGESVMLARISKAIR